MRSVESIARTYLRNQNQYINHFITSCFWKSVNRLGCYRKAWYRKKVFALGTLLKNSQKNGAVALKIWTINAAIYFYRNTVRNSFFLMDSFWDEIKDFNFDLKWLFKVRNHLEKFERKLQETKRKKLSNLSKNAEIKKLVLARFKEHLPHFEFKVDFTSFCESRCQDFDNIHTLLTLNESNNSKNESDVFFQASQNNRTEFANNIQNNAENEIRNSAENSSSSKVDNVLNESENVAMFR